MRNNLNKQFFIKNPKELLALPSILKIRNYTMARLGDVYQMRHLVKKLDEEGIEGAVVETGCWRGGLGAHVATLGRKVWLFDSFEGLPALEEQDAIDAERLNIPLNLKVGFIKTDDFYAREIAERLCVQPTIIRGWFCDTLPQYKEKIGPIAILRLDGDTYASTKEALENLYEKVVPGGVIVIDDYDSWDGCRAALYEFFVRNNISPIIKRGIGRPFFYK